MEDKTWKKKGNCKDVDPNLFYPSMETNQREYERQEETAKLVCNGTSTGLYECPVIDQCLEFALRNNEFGVWGGTSEKERRKIRRRQQRAKRQAS